MQIKTTKHQQIHSVMVLALQPVPLCPCVRPHGYLCASGSHLEHASSNPYEFYFILAPLYKYATYIGSYVPHKGLTICLI